MTETTVALQERDRKMAALHEILLQLDSKDWARRDDTGALAYQLYDANITETEYRDWRARAALGEEPYASFVASIEADALRAERVSRRLARVQKEREENRVRREQCLAAAAEYERLLAVAVATERDAAESQLAFESEPTGERFIHSSVAAQVAKNARAVAENNYRENCASIDSAAFWRGLASLSSR